MSASKGRNIRWRNNDEAELKKQIRAFNNKVARLEKKQEYKDVILPNKLNYKVLKNQINSRTDFNIRKEQIETFVKGYGSEKIVKTNTGVKLLLGDVRNAKQNFDLAEKTKAKLLLRLNEIDMKDKGKKAGYKRGQIGDIEAKQYEKKEFNIDKIKGKKEWEHFVKGIEAKMSEQFINVRDEKFKQTYINEIKKAYGDSANEIIKKIQNMDGDKFYKTYKENTEAEIQFFSDSPLKGLTKEQRKFYLKTIEEERTANLERLGEIWG